MDDTGAGKVRVTVTKTEVNSQLRKPTSTPRPVCEQGIGERAQDHRGHGKGDVLPALRGRSCNDRECRVHEHHLEEEQHHDGDVVRGSAQEEAARPENSPRLAKQRKGVLGIQGHRATQRSSWSDATHLQSEPAHPERKQPETIDHEVHHHGVIRILRAAQSCFHDGKPGLHEHNEEAGNKGPHEVDGNPVLPNLIYRIGQGQPLVRVRDHDIVHGPGLRSAGVTLGQIIGRRRLRRLYVQGRIHGRTRRWCGCGWCAAGGALALRPGGKPAQQQQRQYNPGKSLQTFTHSDHFCLLEDN